MAASRAAIAATGTQVAFVHMSSREDADHWFAKHGLSDVPRFSDPDHHIYKAFGLGEGSFFELGHPRVWGRWLQSALRRGAGPQGSHWRQLTGVFLVHRGRIIRGIRFKNSAARPNYAAFVTASTPHAGLQ